MRKTKLLVFLFGVLLSISCLCTPSTIPFLVRATETELPASTFPPAITEEVVVEKPSETATEEVELESTEEMTATDSPTDTPEPTATSTQIEKEAWRINPMPDAQFITSEKIQDESWEKTMASQAANLAIPAPYFYDVWQLPDGTRYLNVRTYYNQDLVAKGYKLMRDEQGAGDVYLLVFAKTEIKSKIAIQFQTSTSKRPCLVLILYSNPE